MHIFTRRIGLLVVLGASVWAQAPTASAQVQAFTFTEKGRVFSTSPNVWMASSSDARSTVLQYAGSASYKIPAARFIGVNIGGQYFFHGLSLGYNLGFAASPKVENSPAGDKYIYRTRDYAGDVSFSLGVIALRAKTFLVIPTYGIGAGLWASHFQQIGVPESGGQTADSKESAVATTHIMHDGGLQLLYILPQKKDGGSRFTIGLKTGYKAYALSNSIHSATVTTSDGPRTIGLGGGYVQLSLGMGLLKYKVK